MDAIFEITVIGSRYRRDIENIFSTLKVNVVNEIKEGRLGNFNTLTYFLKVNESEVVKVRRDIMATIAADGRLIAMYPHGEWMHVYIFETLAFKES